jgi:hypothetical protein
VLALGFDAMTRPASCPLQFVESVHLRSLEAAAACRALTAVINDEVLAHCPWATSMLYRFPAGPDPTAACLRCDADRCTRRVGASVVVGLPPKACAAAVLAVALRYVSEGLQRLPNSHLCRLSDLCYRRNSDSESQGAASTDQ